MEELGEGRELHYDVRLGELTRTASAVVDAREPRPAMHGGNVARLIKQAGKVEALRTSANGEDERRPIDVSASPKTLADGPGRCCGTGLGVPGLDEKQGDTVLEVDPASPVVHRTSCRLRRIGGHQSTAPA